MRIRVVLFTTAILLMSSGLFTAISAKAGEDENAEGNGYAERVEELRKKIEEIDNKIDELKGREKTLRGEIEFADAQMSRTETKIQASIVEIERKTRQIDSLSYEIDTLRSKIKELENEVDRQEIMLGERLRARYKALGFSPLVILFGADSLEKLIQKSAYLHFIQIQDKRLLDEMEATRNRYDLDQFSIEVNKEQVEKLRTQIIAEKANLERYRRDLQRQKEDKQKLLERTENDETKYQALLAQVKSELAALQLAINLPEGEGSSVKRGDVIGAMGNTGCSSGPHVHFGYVKDGKVKDPLPLLNVGRLSWPVDNYEITQYFGENYSFYMNNFGVSGHDAIDIISKSQWSGAPIRAARDGNLYYAQDSKVYCPWLNNSIGKGAIIDHGDGERTIYWHLR
ncbi:peptidoglycan DD-metalloendopeptidase family protein [candidate division WWE3 bacterium]|nr:peptidoglycan DD-metalloendopeptidase family protein [candidate division WWE3 bacterium]